MVFIKFILLLSFTALSCFALDDEKLEDNLASLKNNQYLFYKKHPEKLAPINNEKIIDKNSKIDFRSKLFLSKYDIGPTSRNDYIENLIPNGEIIRTLEELEELKLTNGEVSTSPWSDDYWPIYKGLLGQRYAIPFFASQREWDKYFDHISKNNALKIYETSNEALIDQLSPSEKYDLVLGLSADKSLTKSMWSTGREYHEEYGKVETWMGICHGWAQAAYMVERPRTKVTVIAKDGVTPVNFYPADIKALASLLWANTDTAAEFTGSRCFVTNPETTPNGRIKEKECLDSNPATWHMAVTNLVGNRKTSFVMDATYDYEVWNQPVVSYEYTYFDVRTKNKTKDLKKAMVKLAEVKNEELKLNRHPRTKYIVGIAMEVEYTVETSPYQREEESEANDRTTFVQYFYDLEIDSSGEIIGGEWYQKAHPDFLWTPVKGSKPLSWGDYSLLGDPLWDGREVLSKKWNEAAEIAAKRSQPLSKFIDSLIIISNNQGDHRE